MSVTVIEHPLAGHLLAQLRDEDTPPPVFRTLAKRLAFAIALEAIRDLPTTDIRVKTPLEETDGRVLGDLVAVPILRAGLGMLEGMLKILSGAGVAHIGLFRNEETHLPESYYFKAPPYLPEAEVLVVDPMLATAGSMIATASLLKSRGCTDIRALVLVAAPEGIRALEAAHPDVRCWTAAIDSHLNEVGYIIPGLGDAGDKIFGTKAD